MLGQQPQVGMSSLPIAHELLESLATETEVNHCFGLEGDVPLEDARVKSRNGFESVIESSFSMP